MTAQHQASIVWWNANSVHVDDVILRRSLEAARAGFGALVRSPIGAHGAMRRAMARRQGALEEHQRWAEVGVEKDLLVVALTEATADVANRDWKAGVKLQITVDRTNGNVDVDRPFITAAEKAAVDQLRARYALERAELTQGDVRDIVLKILLGKNAGKGVRIKEGGSLYLLQAPHDDIVDAVRPAFAEAGLHLRSMPIFEESMAQLRTDVRTGLLGECDDVRDAIKKLAAGLPDFVRDGARIVKVRPSTLLARREELDDLRRKAQLFRMVLGDDLLAIEQALDQSIRLIADVDASIMKA